MHARRNVLEARGVEPLEARVRCVLIRIAHHIRTRAASAGPDNTERGRIGSSGSRDSERQTGVEVRDRRSLPSAERLSNQAFLTPEKRQLVGKIRREDVTSIQCCSAVLTFVPVVEILRRAGAVGLVVCKILGPSVRERKERAIAEALLRVHLQRVIVGVEPGLDDVDCVISLERSQCIERCFICGSEGRGGGSKPGCVREIRENLVDVRDSQQVRPFGPYIADLQYCRWCYLALNVKAPLLCIGSPEIGCGSTQNLWGILNVGRS